jgi:hypothetical protein
MPGGGGDRAPGRGDALHSADAVHPRREARVGRLGDDDVDLRMEATSEPPAFWTSPFAPQTDQPRSLYRTT